MTSLGDATVTDPIEALNDVVPRMRDAGAEVVGVLSHVSNDRVRGVDNFDGRGIAASVDGAICSFVGDEYDFLGEVILDVENGIEGFDRTVYDVSEGSRSAA